MQPYSATFALENLTSQRTAVQIGEHSYRAEIGPEQGWVTETGPDGEKNFPIAHVMGGKNVYYFLTFLERGRLQTLPVAYDVHSKEWYDTAASGVRHFPAGPDDEPLHWTDSAYTFNTSCYNCHVSQLATNYDLKTDTYNTVWEEPGINCEVCHGPAEEHVEVCWKSPPDQVPEDLKIIQTGDFTAEQTNTMCAPCHAKMRPLTNSMLPGERYFDHYDLIALEHPDFYPDGRDLGENYTYTTWRMSPCLASQEFDCLHCHTSSARYRHKDDPDQSCLPCHEERVNNAFAHHQHPEGKPGSHCIDCHMPMTRFAAMNRTDHSMLPPTPAVTLAFESPNACNLCHEDKEASWAEKWVREWRSEDYQAPILHRTGLIDAARKREWKRLPEMLAYLKKEDRDEIFATSLIRLLVSCGDEGKYPALLDALKDPSPLVRSVAAEGLAGYFTPDGIEALLRATDDEFRLVRIQAAGALAGLPAVALPAGMEESLKRASEEMMASLTSRPDDWSSHYNLGNYFMTQGRLEKSLAAFKTATKLRPDAVLPLVNTSIVHARLGKEPEAEKALRRALELAPKNAAANFNLGLLLAGKGETEDAEWCLRTALEADPTMDRAAYNLGLLLASDRPEEAVAWLKKAREQNPKEPQYSYTLAFYQAQNGDTKNAIEILQSMVDEGMNYPDAYLFLIELHKKEGSQDEAERVMRQALSNASLSSRFREHLGSLLGKTP